MPDTAALCPAYPLPTPTDDYHEAHEEHEESKFTTDPRRMKLPIRVLFRVLRASVVHSFPFVLFVSFVVSFSVLSSESEFFVVSFF
jgi:hypothetical protein